MPRHNPKIFFLAVAAIMIAVISGTLWWMRLNVLYAYLIGVNTAVVLFYGYDKQQSATHRRRVPELTLHILALSGGVLGAFLGQTIFRHKTRKLKFRIVSLAILALQIILIFCYWRVYLRPQ